MINLLEEWCRILRGSIVTSLTHADHQSDILFTFNVSVCKMQLLFSPLETIWMNCQFLISGKNKQQIWICHLLKILRSILSVNLPYFLSQPSVHHTASSSPSQQLLFWEDDQHGREVFVCCWTFLSHFVSGHGMVSLQYEYPEIVGASDKIIKSIMIVLGNTMAKKSHWILWHFL